MTALIEVSGGIAECVAGDCEEIRDLDNWKDDPETCPGPFTAEEKAAANKAARIARAAPELLAELKRSSFELHQLILNRDHMDEDAMRRWARGIDAAIAKAEGAQ